MKRVALLLVAGLVFAPGCRRKDSTRLIPTPGGRPEWATSDVTAFEGSTIQVTLTLLRAPVDEPEVVSLESNNTSAATVPDSVTFPVGSTSQSVSITTLADDLDIDKDPVIKASTNAGSSELHLHIVEDDIATGPAHGPVSFGSGTALLTGAGADLVFGTADEELIVATGVGLVTPVLFKVKVGLLTTIDASLPVVAGTGDAVLVLGTESGATRLFQIQSTTSAPEVTASVSILGTVAAAQRPVMVGTRAVIVSLGLDGLPGADDGVFIVEGIGTTTLTTKTVVIPGLTSGGASTPVPFGSTAFLITSAGPDMLFATGDEALGIVTAIDTATPVVTPLYSGRIAGDSRGLGIAAGATTVAVPHAGVDAALGTADDELQVIRNVPAAPAPALPLVVGPLTSDSSAVALATGADSVLLPLLGADLLAGTSDDDIALVTSLSVDPMAVTGLAASSPPSGVPGRLVLLSGSAAARLSEGPDGSLGTADDAVILLTALGVAPVTASFSTGAVASAGPFVSGPASLVLIGEGPDAILGTDDDRALEVTGIGSGPALTFRGSGPFDFLGAPALIPAGAGHAIAARNSGPDATASTADDRLGVASVP